ncbi:hypothetical protein CDD82_205 [Ophiocordyceps australis]|uniref:Uncharacterized protein n=1 Tax=Ophiocordyceps australis TaxID=1399860 RepID=A0A2C5ZPB4_9HYPO|nr:hypothetical protein CDD82_205 [Ophiocordyceps australis]
MSVRIFRPMDRQREMLKTIPVPGLLATALDTLSDLEIEDAGEASPGKAAQHKAAKGTETDPYPPCCELAFSAKVIQRARDPSDYLLDVHFEDLVYPEYVQERKHTFFVLGGRVIHKFLGYGFSKAIPKEIKGNKYTPWKHAICFLPIFDKSGDWRKEYIERLGFLLREKDDAFLCFWRWLCSFDEEESKKRYINLALYSLAHLQYSKRDINNRPNTYEARVVVDFRSDHTFAYLYKAVFPWKSISTPQRKRKVHPNWERPIVTCRKIPYDNNHGFQAVLNNELRPRGFSKVTSED